MLRTSTPVDRPVPEMPGEAARSPQEWAREGWCCARGRDLVGALQCFQRALDVDINCYEAWLGLSQIFLDLHDTQRAVRCLEVARRLRRGLPCQRPATA